MCTIANQEGMKYGSLSDVVLERIAGKLPLSSLTQFSLVNRCWRELSLQYLFRNIKVHFLSVERVELFFKLLKSKGHLIHSINFTKLVLNKKLKSKFLSNFYQLRYLINLKELILPAKDEQGRALFSDLHVLKLLDNKQLTQLDCGTILDYSKHRQISIMNKLSTLTNLTSLTLYYDLPNLPPSFLPFIHLPNLKYLESFATVPTVLSLIENQTIQRLETWKIIDIYMEESTSLLVQAFQTAINLSHLVLNYDSRTYNNYLGALSEGKKIKNINISDNDDTPVNDLLQFIQSNPQLEHFSIYRNSFTDDKVDILISNCPNLKGLKFFNTHVSAQGIENVLMKCNNLESLYINLGSIAPPGIPITSNILRSSNALRNLKKLYLQAPVQHITNLLDNIDVLSEIEDLDIYIYNENGDNICGILNNLIETMQIIKPNFNLLKFKLDFNYSFMVSSNDSLGFCTFIYSDIKLNVDINTFFSALLNCFPALMVISYCFKINPEQLDKLQNRWPHIMFSFSGEANRNY